MPANRIFVDIDVLLDTRIALFRRHDHQRAAIWLANGYRARYSDEFWKVSPAVSKEAIQDDWANRDVSLLRESIKTHGGTLLAQVIASIDWGPHLGEDDNHVIVTVNTAPYNLSPVEMEGLQQVLETDLPIVKEFKIVNIPLWVLNPKHLGDNYDLVVMYNFMEWFRSYSERMAEFEMRNIDVIAPRLFHELPEKDSEDWKALESGDMFELLSARLLGRCRLTFEDPLYFSIIGS